MKKKLLKIGVIAAAALMLSGWFVMPSIASGARNCDSNAVIYCGAYSLSELNSDIKNGTGKKYQSGKELTALFNKFGYTPGQDGVTIKEGRVTRDNKVYVGTKRVASDVYSMGRSYMAGSKDVAGISYPLWLRHPSVSFRSSSIDAFVLLNYDGSFRMAVIKSCGNIVPGTIRHRPAPAPTYRLYAHKFIDANENGRYENGERPQSGVAFRLSGNGITRTARSGNDGFAGFYGLPAGRYTITETVPAGYHATTANPQTVTLRADRTIVRFGNAVTRRAVVQIRVIKFEDVNGNRVQDNSEDNLAGWQFMVTGNGQTRTITTGENGSATIGNLTPGSYTVTEINQTGWTNTTGLAVTRNVTEDSRTQTFVFGNRRVTTPPPPPVTPPTGGGDVKLPVSGPGDVAGAAVASMSLSGGILAWIRSKRRLLDILKK